jgi:hypothetical protein
VVRFTDARYAVIYYTVRSFLKQTQFIALYNAGYDEVAICVEEVDLYLA